MSVPQTPQPPCAAYRILAPLFTPGYFLKPPPVEGVELVITGLDGVATWWCMNEPTADVLRPHVIAHPELRLTADRLYRPAASASGDTAP